MDDRKTETIAAWMIAGWVSLTVVMVAALVAVTAGIGTAVLAPVLGVSPFSFALARGNIKQTFRMPAALVCVTCAATVTGLLIFALFGEACCG